MKMNKEIISMYSPIYDFAKGNTLYHDKKFGCRELSLMKQENIRVAIKERRESLGNIKSIIDKLCGYCFRFRDAVDCNTCPLLKRCRKTCYSIHEAQSMRRAKTFKRLSITHERWCKKLGLWEEGWE